jgi:hypothetical protein
MYQSAIVEITVYKLTVMSKSLCTVLTKFRYHVMSKSEQARLPIHVPCETFSKVSLAKSDIRFYSFRIGTVHFADIGTHL